MTDKSISSIDNALELGKVAKDGDNFKMLTPVLHNRTS